MSDISDKLSHDEKQKSEELIRAFLKTPDGRKASEAIGRMTKEEINRLINSAPAEELSRLLADSEKLRAALNDPKALEKLKSRLK
ncbi:MAG: hypothetical protein IJG50_03905 [Clostridia bacterium]|nr:hypothetical protein [Clostridia bacterium]